MESTSSELAAAAASHTGGGMFWSAVLAVAVLVASFYVKRLVRLLFERHLSKLAQYTRFKFDDVMIAAAGRPASWAVVFIALYAALEMLHFEHFIARAAFIQAVLGFLLAMFLLRFVDGMAEHLKASVARTGTMLDDAVLPAIRTALKVAVVILVALYIADSLGFQIRTFLAGLGIGGLALAFAAQGTLANWFGAFMIFADRPFAAGEVITVGGVTGTVEQVGLRSTSIRTLDGSVVTIPNAAVANAQVENLSRIPARRYNGVIGIAAGTPLPKVKQALAMIGRILSDEPGVKETVLVRLEDLGAQSLKIRIIYLTKTSDYGEHMAVREAVNLSILRGFAEAGISIAFPV